MDKITAKISVKNICSAVRKREVALLERKSIVTQLALQKIRKPH
jgi:hypothetical protein